MGLSMVVGDVVVRRLGLYRGRVMISVRDSEVGVTHNTRKAKLQPPRPGDFIESWHLEMRDL